jgi:hypothetical protein
MDAAADPMDEGIMTPHCPSLSPSLAFSLPLDLSLPCMVALTLAPAVASRHHSGPPRSLESSLAALPRCQQRLHRRNQPWAPRIVAVDFVFPAGGCHLRRPWRHRLASSGLSNHPFLLVVSYMCSQTSPSPSPRSVSSPLWSPPSAAARPCRR